jgi:hypothetical protein
MDIKAKLAQKGFSGLFEKQGDTSEKESKDINVLVKLFNPLGNQRWYLYEKEDSDIYWCYANLGDKYCAELGTVSINELASLNVGFGMGIEIDMSFAPRNLQEVIDLIQNDKHV